MVTDRQVRRLFGLVQTERTLAMAAAKAGMDEKTARKYRRSGRLRYLRGRIRSALAGRDVGIVHCPTRAPPSCPVAAP